MTALAWFEIKAYLSVPVALFWTLAYPFAMLFVLLAFFDDGSAQMVGLEGYRFGLITGMLSLTIASTAIFGFAQALSEMKTNRSLMILVTLPIPRYQSLLAIIMSRVVIITVFALLYVPLSFLYARPEVPINAQNMIMLFVTTGAFSFLSYTVSLPALYMAKKTSTVIALANIINIYAIITSDAFFPISILPVWVKPFILTSPFYYLTEAIRLSFTDEFLNFGILVTLAIVVSLILLRSFSGSRTFAR